MKGSVIKIILSLFLFVSMMNSYASNNVKIKDEMLLNYLVQQGISSNEDGTYNEKELEKITEYVAFQLPIPNELGFLKNLKKIRLWLGSTFIKTDNDTILVDLSKITNQFESIEVNEIGHLVLFVNIDEQNQLQSLSLTGNCVLLRSKRKCSSLKYLDVRGGNMNGFDFGLFPNLKFLNCSRFEIQTLSLVDNLNIEELNCSNNQLLSLDLSQNCVLKSLDCSYNGFERFENIILPKSIQYLNLNGNFSYGGEIRLSDFPNLKTVFIENVYVNCQERE